MDSACRLRRDLFVTLLAKLDGSFKQSDYTQAKGAVGSFLSQLSVVMTKLLYKMNKHCAAHRRS